MPLNSRIFEIPRRLLTKKKGFSIDFGKKYNVVNACLIFKGQSHVIWDKKFMFNI